MVKFPVLGKFSSCYLKNLKKRYFLINHKNTGEDKRVEYKMFKLAELQSENCSKLTIKDHDFRFSIYSLKFLQKIQFLLIIFKGNLIKKVNRF